MGDYEKKHEKPIKLWEEVLSADDTDFSPDVKDKILHITATFYKNLSHLLQLVQIMPKLQMTLQLFFGISTASQSIDERIEEVILQSINYINDDNGIVEEQEVTVIVMDSETGESLRDQETGEMPASAEVNLETGESEINHTAPEKQNTTRKFRIPNTNQEKHTKEDTSDEDNEIDITQDSSSEWEGVEEEEVGCSV
ncbi:hypothetical protein FQR65_LT04747 [Abscondita terminalis]|nr:hypothetical protein FQR65_LT04747 [Abscondita terminalis]